MSNKINEEEIKNLAERLLIDLNQYEIKEIQNELLYFEEQMSYVNKLDLDNIEPLFHPFDLFEGTLREDDDLDNGDDIKDLLANTKHIEGREVKVPKVVG